MPSRARPSARAGPWAVNQRRVPHAFAVRIRRARRALRGAVLGALDPGVGRPRPAPHRGPGRALATPPAQPEPIGPGVDRNPRRPRPQCGIVVDGHRTGRHRRMVLEPRIGNALLVRTLQTALRRAGGPARDDRSLLLPAAPGRPGASASRDRALAERPGRVSHHVPGDASGRNAAATRGHGPLHVRRAREAALHGRRDARRVTDRGTDAISATSPGVG